MKAREYSAKAVRATDQRLKEGYQALAHEYVFRANRIIEDQTLNKRSDD